jgi:hypothetical protein
MAWVNWSRKQALETKRNRSSLGIDLNATRARAATGAAARGQAVLLDDPHPDLPLAVSMEKRALELGRAGTALCRRLPHLACIGHLPYLGHPQEWKGGRHRIDTAMALTLVLEKLRSACSGFDSVYLGLPAYMTAPQVAKIAALATKSRFAIKGVSLSALALAADRACALLNSQPQESATTENWIVPLHRAGKTPLPADAIVIDADEYALCASLVQIDANRVRAVASTALQKLSTRLWKERLLTARSDRCVRVCRRDPRDSAAAEQSLYEQIDESLDLIRLGQKVVLTVRAAHWYQDLELAPEEFDNYCSTLTGQAVDGIRALLNSGLQTAPPRAVWLTHEAGRLPGLAQSLHQNMAERTNVGVLRPESVAVAIANLGERCNSGELPHAPFDTSIPIQLKRPESKAPPPSAKTVR